MRLDRMLTLAGLLAAGLVLTACSVQAAPTRPPQQSCGVGLAGTTYLLRQTGPHARAHCAANVKRSKPIGGFWSTRTSAGLVLVCQTRYNDGLLDQVYAASRDDVFARMTCAQQADDIRHGKARAVPVHKR